METNIVPELSALIEATAEMLMGSTEDSMIIEGADNKTLVKMPSNTFKQKLQEGMILFPVTIGEQEYAVCVTEKR